MWPYTPDQETMMTSRRPATGRKKDMRMQRAAVAAPSKPRSVNPGSAELDEARRRRQSTGTGNFRSPRTS